MSVLLAPSHHVLPHAGRCTSRQLLTGAAAYLSHTAWYARVAAASCLESLARLEYSKVEPALGQRKDTSGGASGASGASGARGGGGGGGDALTNELAKGWVGLGDVRLDEVLERGALLLSHGEDVRGVGGGGIGERYIAVRVLCCFAVCGRVNELGAAKPNPTCLLTRVVYVLRILLCTYSAALLFDIFDFRHYDT